jgi:hypothetical protein
VQGVEVGEKGLAAQETGVLVQLCLLARSFAGSVGGDVSGLRADGVFVDLSNDTTYLY